MEIPYSSEAGTGVEPPAILPSQELVMIWSSHDIAMAGSSSGSGVTHELVWPCPGDPRKAWFVLYDDKEVALWHFLTESGVSMESDLTQTRATLKEVLEWVKSFHRTVMIDLPHVLEVSPL